MRPTPPSFDPQVKSALDEAKALLAAGDRATALAVYARAWDGALERDDHFHASVIAHMAGVVEDDPTKKHEWNLAALREADAVADRKRVKGTYASNYNNLGLSYALLGDRDKARESFALALSAVADIDPGPYAEQVRGGIERNVARLSAPT